MLPCVDARPLRQAPRFAVLAAVVLCAASVLVAAPPAEAVGPRPAFQIPFRCGERWRAFTRSGHPAIDWNFGTGSDDLGKTVTAAAAGTAVPKYHSAYGYYVDIDHGGGWVTRYAHLLSSGRASGDVAQGEPIGRVGSTGSSTSPHLHWEQRAGDVAQNTLTADGKILDADGRTYSSRNCLRRDPFLSGDVDGDGIDDLVARFVGSDGSSTIRIIGGAGRSELSPRRSLSLTPADLPASALLSLGDTNGDGRADLNAAYGLDDGVKFVSFYGTTDGTFGDRNGRHFGSGWSFARMKSVQAGDVDGDGIEDLVAQFSTADGGSVVRTIRGAASNALSSRRTKAIDSSVLPGSAPVAVGDTNGDGRADLNAAVRRGSGISLISFYGKGTTTFGRRRYRHSSDTWGVGNLKGLHIADVHGDGVEDFVTRSVRNDGGSNLRVIRGRTERALRRVAKTRLGPAALPRASHIAIGDTNDNRRADFNVAFAGGGGTQFASFYGKADGSFGARSGRYTSEMWQFHRLC